MSTIWVIEDETDTLELLIFTLLGAGYGVRYQSDPHTALRNSTGPPVDLIALGWRIPSPEGLGLCRRLRSDPRFAQTPIVLISDTPSGGEIESGLQAGADDFIITPFSPDQALAQIGAALCLRSPATDTKTGPVPLTI